MEESEFEKYFERITDCMYDCKIIKAERRTKMRQILEEIENNSFSKGMDDVMKNIEMFTPKEAKP